MHIDSHISSSSAVHTHAAINQKEQAQDALVADVHKAYAAHPDKQEKTAEVLTEGLKRIRDTYGNDATDEVIAKLAKTDPKALASAIAGEIEKVPYGGKYDAEAHANFVHGLQKATQSLNYSELQDLAKALSNPELTSNSASAYVMATIAKTVSETGADSLQTQYVQEGLKWAQEYAKDVDQTDSSYWSSEYVGALGLATKNSPEAANAIIDWAKNNDIGHHKKGEDALEYILQSFVSHDFYTPVDKNSSQTNSYITFLQSAASSRPGSGALSSENALLLFKTIANSESINGLTLLEQDNVRSDNKGTELAATLFRNYLPDWINKGMIQTSAGALKEDMYQPLTNFFREAGFDKNEKGSYRNGLIQDIVADLNKLTTGQIGSQMSDHDRMALLGSLVKILDEGFNSEADDIKADGEAKKMLFGTLVDTLSAGTSLLKLEGVPGVLAGLAIDHGKDGIKNAVNGLIDKGVDKKTAEAAVQAAVDGDFKKAFSLAGLNGKQQQKVAEIIDNHQTSLRNGKLSLGELTRIVFTELYPQFASDINTRGWDEVEDTLSNPGR